MATGIIKKISLYDKENNLWTTKNIGAVATNISLNQPILGKNSVESALHGFLPNEEFVLPKDDQQQDLDAIVSIDKTNKQIKVSEYSKEIIDFFKPNGGLSNNVNQDNINSYIAAYISSEQEGQFPAALNLNEILNVIYPVGSIFTSLQPTAPGDTIGGLWEPIEGYFLYPSTSGVGSTGGSATTNTTVSLNLSSLISNHNFNITKTLNNCQTAPAGYGLTRTSVSEAAPGKVLISTGTNTIPSVTIGTSLSHSATNTTVRTGTISLFPPYLRVYMWKRVSLIDPSDPNQRFFEHTAGALKNSIIQSLEDTLNTRVANQVAYQIANTNTVRQQIINIIENNSNIILSNKTKTLWDTILTNNNYQEA